MKERRIFAKYVCSSVLGMLGLSCYILADTYFVSAGLGAGGLAALNLAIPIYSLIHGAGLMLGMGGAAQYSIAKGQNARRMQAALFTHALCLGAALAAAYVLAGLLLAPSIAVWLGADAQVFAMTQTYLQTLLLFAPAFLLNDILLCFVRNDGGAHLSMCAMLFGSLLNIALDYVFVFPLQMGIFGAVLATGLSPLASVGVLSLHWLRGRATLRPARTGLRCALRILATGAPSLVAELSAGVVIVVFNGILLHLCGNIGVAAYGVVANLSLVTLAIYTGVAQGMQPLASEAWGQGDAQKARRMLRYALCAVLLCSLALWSAIYGCTEAIVCLFNAGGDVQLQALATGGMRLYFTGAAFAGCNIVLSLYFAATGRAIPAQAISLARGLAFILPGAFLLAALFGIDGVWLSFPAAELLAASLGTGIYLHAERKRQSRSSSACAYRRSG